MEEFKPVNGQPNRRKFAARYSYQWQGWTLVAIGVFGAAGAAESLSYSSIFVGLALTAWGVYLLRGVGQKPKAETTSKDSASLGESKNLKATSTAGFRARLLARLAVGRLAV